MRRSLRGGHAQKRRYGRPGRNSCHSARVRLRFAIRQAAASHDPNVTGTTQVRPVSSLTTTRVPSGENAAFAWELFLGIYCTFWGFRLSSPILRDDEREAAPAALSPA